MKRIGSVVVPWVWQWVWWWVWWCCGCSSGCGGAVGVVVGVVVVQPTLLQLFVIEQKISEAVVIHQRLSR